MMQYSLPEAYDLIHQGALALAQVEQNGIKIDTEYVTRTRREIQTECKEKELWMRKHPHWKAWRKKYGQKALLGSSDQLAFVLFDILGYNIQGITSTGKASTDRASLEKIDDPFVRTYTEWGELLKADNTFLAGIERETINGYLHAVFNLHIVKTYRSSSETPNFQNFPVRNKRISQIIRSAFIPREGNRLVEIDYSGIEVRIAACYHKDPTMLEYIHDPTKDMHRDMAAEIYLCEQEQVNKQLRYVAKNRYVFPEFYGSYWEKVGPDLWDAITLYNLTVTTAEGEIPVQQWLHDHGIIHLGGGKLPPEDSFMHHVRKVEHDFWNRRFPVYDKWKKDWYNDYLLNGGYRTLTGFYIKGLYRKNDVINHPVQGSAFHCLLWSLIEIQKRLKKYKMKSKIVGQIHDSIVSDVPESEFDDYLSLSKEVMTRAIRKKWKWIVTPLDIEAEASEVNGTWFDKKEVEIH